MVKNINNRNSLYQVKVEDTKHSKRERNIVGELFHRLYEAIQKAKHKRKRDKIKIVGKYV